MSHLSDLKTLVTLLDYLKSCERVLTPSESDSVDRIMNSTTKEIKELERLEQVEEIDGNQVHRHESYGCLAINITNGGSGNLYGCSVKHSSCVTLTLARSEYHRSNGGDNYFRTDDLFKVNLSLEQWGHLCCSVGNHSGVPVTISRINHRLIQSPPFINKITSVKQDFEKNIKKVTSKIALVKKQVNSILLAKGPISVTQRQEISSTLSSIVQELEANLPYIVQCYDETTNKILTEAKIELDTLIRQSNNIEIQQLNDMSPSFTAIEHNNDQ